MSKRIRLVVIAIALALCGHISGTHADCVEISKGDRKGDLTLIGDCSVGFDGNQKLSIQFASTSTDDDQSPVSAEVSGGLFPTNRGMRRYICTPSGFGHIASCGPHSIN
jgi:hypothetical protein